MLVDRIQKTRLLRSICYGYLGSLSIVTSLLPTVIASWAPDSSPLLRVENLSLTNTKLANRSFV
jgi:hypothetical protein